MELDSILKDYNKYVNKPNIELNKILAEGLKQVKKKLPKEYHNFLNIFNRVKVTELPPYQDADCKLELTNNPRELPRSRVYPLSIPKLRVYKEYFIKNLKKGYIVPSRAAFALPILFALKKDGSLRFCVDYRRLNIFTKKDRYPLLLIEKTLARVTSCKYLIKIDIIVVFNLLRISPKSEEFTIFITSIGIYKYKIMPFGLLNRPVTWQYYINNLLFEYLNDFA